MSSINIVAGDILQIFKRALHFVSFEVKGFWVNNYQSFFMELNSLNLSLILIILKIIWYNNINLSFSGIIFIPVST